MQFLNAGGALLVLPILVVFMVIAILLESWIMHLRKYQVFKKSLLPVLIANLISLFGGFGLLEVLGGVIEPGRGSALIGLLILFIATLILEGIVIYLFNRNKSVNKTAAVVTLMNLTTYVLYFILFMMMVRPS